MRVIHETPDIVWPQIQVKTLKNSTSGSTNQKTSNAIKATSPRQHGIKNSASHYSTNGKSKLTHSTTKSDTKTPGKTRYSPTFLWGIPSVKDEVERRKVVRETYLSYYKESDEPNRICSLADIQSHKIPLEDCQIAYTFFLGGNPNGPTELVKPNASFPMVMVDAPKDEDDVVYLNIKENMEDGKSQTWLKYASMVVQDFPFDYVAKADSDTLLFTPAFLQYAEEALPARPNNTRTYGGYPHYKTSCDPNVNDTHSCPLPLVGDVYMAGALYWMSADLATFVTSNAVDRTSLTIRHEDVDIGNFVFSHPEKVKTVRVKPSSILIHRVVDSNWEQRDEAYTFRGMYWGHSENGFWPGPFFKNLHHYRKMWSHFQAYWLSNQTLMVRAVCYQASSRVINVFAYQLHSWLYGTYRPKTFMNSSTYLTMRAR
jgi:hypothetical protein